VSRATTSKIQPGISCFDRTFVHDAENWRQQLHSYFCKFDSNIIRNGIQKIIEIRCFVEKKHSLSSEMFLASNRQTTGEKIAKYNQNWKSELFDQAKKWGPCHFLINNLEWADILVFIVTFYGLSNETIKYHI
jgi:hypothetical protein